jgi:hypothetical protein
VTPHPAEVIDKDDHDDVEETSPQKRSIPRPSAVSICAQREQGGVRIHRLLGEPLLPMHMSPGTHFGAVAVPTGSADYPAPATGF